jgi:hypothetical protein
VRVTPGQTVDGEALLVVLERLDVPVDPGPAAPRKGSER